MKTYFNINNKLDVYDKVQSGSLQTTPANDIMEDTLNQYLKMLAATDSLNKRYIKKALPNHNILIQISAQDYTSAVEFSRILCAALDEELLSQSYPHTDSKSVEVECTIAGPINECFAAVSQLANVVAETFKQATQKIGGISINTNCLINKKSSYQPISLRSAETNYRKFLLKFV